MCYAIIGNRTSFVLKPSSFFVVFGSFAQLNPNLKVEVRYCY